jgi:hypothetical protein
MLKLARVKKQAWSRLLLAESASQILSENLPQYCRSKMENHWLEMKLLIADRFDPILLYVEQGAWQESACFSACSRSQLVSEFVAKQL